MFESSGSFPDVAKRFLLHLLGCALAVGTGCTAYHPHPIDPSSTAAAFEKRSLKDPGLLAFVSSADTTFSLTPSPPLWDLTALTLAAFYYSPDLDLARAQWDVARAVEVTAGQRPSPSLSIGPGVSSTIDSPSPWILSSLVDLTLETGGKRGARLDRSRSLSEAARLHVAAVAWEVRSRVRSGLEALHTARETRRLLVERARLQAENVRNMEERFSAGSISGYERSRARLAAQQTRLALHDAERSATEAAMHLAAAVGLPPEAVADAPFAFEALDSAPRDTLLAHARTRAMLNRADLLQALAAYAASEAALREEVAKQYPDLHLGPGYEFDQGNNKWSLGLGIALPLNGNRGPIAEAEARRQEAAAQFGLIQQNVIASVATTMAGYRTARNKLAEADAIVQEEQAIVRRAQAQVAVGALSEADLVAIRLERDASILARLNTLSEVRQELGRLEDALQSPLGIAPEAWQVAPRTSALITGITEENR